MKKPVFKCHCNGIANPVGRWFAETFRCLPLIALAKLGLVEFIEHDGRRVSTFAEDRAARAAARA